MDKNTFLKLLTLSIAAAPLGNSFAKDNTQNNGLIMGYWNSAIKNDSPFHISNLRIINEHRGSLVEVVREQLGPKDQALMYKLETNYLGQLSFDTEITLTDNKNNLVSVCFLHSGIGSYFANPDFTGSYCSNSNLFVNPSYDISNNTYDAKYTISRYKKLSRIFIFGDSLSDTGNTYKMDMGTVPISPPYNKGHWTNDLVWHEYFIQKISLPEYAVHNYAFGGARAIQGLLPIPSLEKQINNFLLWNKTIDPYALYAIWIGGNDFINGDYDDVNEKVSTVINKIGEQIEVLIARGARYFIAPSLPDLGHIPRAREMDEKLGTHEFSKKQHETAVLFQELLGKKISELQNKYKDNIFISPKALSIAEEIMNNPNNFDIKDSFDRCNPNTYSEYVLEPCNKPYDYMFWDDIHPSSHTHKIIAEFLYNMLIEKGFNFDPELIAANPDNDFIYQQNKKAIDAMTSEHITLDGNSPLF